MLSNWDRAYFSSLWAKIFQACLLENYIQVFLSIKYFVRNLTLQTKEHFFLLYLLFFNPGFGKHKLFTFIYF